MTDIEDQKASHAALAELNARLEERVQERTRDLLNALGRLPQACGERAEQS
jgi:C4-dicarboxylate-specific signal transduction histidine kinase